MSWAIGSDGDAGTGDGGDRVAGAAKTGGDDSKARYAALFVLFLPFFPPSLSSSFFFLFFFSWHGEWKMRVRVLDGAVRDGFEALEIFRSVPKGFG